MNMTVTIIGSSAYASAHAVHIASQGRPVVLYDPDPARREIMCSGGLPDPDEPELAERARAAWERGLIRPAETLDAELAKSEIIAICGLLDEGLKSEFSPQALSVLDQLGRGLGKHALILIESRVPLRATRTKIIPRLEEMSGLSAGSDFSIALSPPRGTAGHVFADVFRFPKLFAGYDERSAKRAWEFYSAVSNTILTRAPDLETAEMVGLVEHANREVAAGFSHEVAARCESSGIDFDVVHTLTNMQPFFPLHRAGITALSEETEGAARRLFESTAKGSDDHPLLCAALRRNDTFADSLVERLTHHFERETGPELHAAESSASDSASNGRLEVDIAVLRSERTPSQRLERFAEALRARGAKLQTLDSLAGSAPARVLILAQDELAWEEIAASAPLQVEVLVDLTQRYRRLAVEKRGWTYLAPGTVGLR